MDGKLWSGLGVVAPLGARVSGAVPDRIGGVSIDTRTLKESDLFVAIKGDNSNGHDYVANAFVKGAAAAVVDEAHADALIGLGSLYIVKDTLKALEGLGRAARARTNGRIVAVTGSVGKTTTKEALRTVLSQFGATHAASASYNNHWGVPLTLARMPQETRFGVFEIGMNHAGEITQLVDMVKPHVAIVTRVAPVHLEHFASVDDIARAKSEIFGGVEKGGVAILNRDDAQFSLLRDAAAKSLARFVLSFGESPSADAKLLSCEIVGDTTRVAADIIGKRILYTIGAPGRHIAMNSLAVLLAARALGAADFEAAAEALAQFKPASGRGRRETLNTANGAFTLIDESYNANPVSMRAALDLLGAAKGERRVAVLGDMLELGGQARDLHAAIAQDVARNEIDLVFAAGPLMSALYDDLPPERRGAYARTAAELEESVVRSIRAGDVVMVKGSNGSRMGPLVDSVRKHFSIFAQAPVQG
ncbi:MAG: UDP-N-acetylmuramoylalanyl-D-glutamyl-2,6-diaminopimelate--D-alanyl-D-alanine ligase [Hyphomicrobiales bacterium]|nr:UDP-N-acetylmuramoylalanyl-D-glutamyl-2,6-diaminopimelate--D-alanyl-D-alanine ligase [Hyphomicrobiales bacterium]